MFLGVTIKRLPNCRFSPLLPKESDDFKKSLRMGNSTALNERPYYTALWFCKSVDKGFFWFSENDSSISKLISQSVSVAKTDISMAPVKARTRSAPAGCRSLIEGSSNHVLCVAMFSGFRSMLPAARTCFQGSYSIWPLLLGVCDHINSFITSTPQSLGRLAS